MPNRVARPGQYLASIGWMGADRIVRMLIGTVVSVLVVRHLGPEQLGHLSYALSLATVFGVVALFGMDSTLPRELLEIPDAQAETMRNAVRLMSYASVLAATTMIAWGAIGSGEFVVTLIVALSLLSRPFQAYDFFFQARVLSRERFIPQSIGVLAGTALRLGGLTRATGASWFALVVTAESFLVGTLLRRKANAILSSEGDKTSSGIAIGQLARSALPMMISTIIGSALTKVDHLLVAELMGIEPLGTYSSAVRLVELWNFVPIAVAASLFPALLETREREGEKYQRRSQALFDLLTWLGLMLAVPTSLLSDQIVLLLYGKDFSEAGQVLRVYIWTVVPLFIGVGASKWYVAEHLEKIWGFQLLVGCVINVLLNLLLIPRFGLVGSAWSSVASYTSAFFLSAAISSHSKPMFWLVVRSFNPWRAPANVLAYGRNLVRRRHE